MISMIPMTPTLPSAAVPPMTPRHATAPVRCIASGRRRRGPGRARSSLRLLLLLLVLAAAAPAAHAVTHLVPGTPAPSIELSDLDGAAFSLHDLAGAPALVMFGELYHPKTLEACRDVAAALDDPRLADQTVRFVLVVAEDADAGVLRSRAKEAAITARILHDAHRTAFGAYRIAVMPSAVIVDGQGRVVHAIAGYTPRFRDVLTDAMLLAAGRLSREQFDKTLHPDGSPRESEEERRAGLITRLANRLARRDLAELAEQKYAEALEIVPDYAPARLGQASLALRRGRLADAERSFQGVLERQPGSVEASLGLVYVQILRGGDELVEAERSLRDLLAAGPGEPRAHYLLGLIQQKLGRVDEAAASYREAAELLMNRRESWNVIPGSETSEHGSAGSSE